MDEHSDENGGSGRVIGLLVVFIATAALAYSVGYQSACRQFYDTLEAHPVSERFAAVADGR